MKRFFTSTGNLNNLTLHELDPNGESLNTQIKASTLGLKEYQLQNIIRNTNNGRVSILNPTGRWTSTTLNVDATPMDRDTHDENETQVMIEPAWTTMESLGLNPDNLEPLQTGTPWDPFCSTEGGFLPGTNVMCVGAPGTGKTSLLMELLASLHNQEKKVLFISAEMNQLDMARYLKRFPNWSQVPILFLNDFDNPKGQLEATLHVGWDLVLIDSYTEVNDLVKEETGWSRGKTEKWFLNLLNSNNMGENKAHKSTCFVTILQMNKGGQFVGSNKLKHMTTSMLHMEWDGKENQGERYMYFSKNRCGKVGIKLYFDVDNNGITWDEARFNRHQSLTETIKQEKEQLQAEGDLFDKIFGFDLEDPKEENLKEVQEA